MVMLMKIRHKIARYFPHTYLGTRLDISAEGGVLAGGLEHLLAEGEVPQGVVEVDL